MEEVEVSAFHSIEKLIKQKKFSEASQELKKTQITNQSLSKLVSIYHELSFDDEEEYQQFLQLLISHINPAIDYGAYKDVVALIISQIINLSSLKYTIVILRGVITKMATNNFGKWIVLSNLYLFSQLLFDRTFTDVISLYDQFKAVTYEILKQLEHDENQGKIDIQKIFFKAITRILRNILDLTKQKDQTKIQETILFLSRLIRDIEQLLLKKQIFQTDFSQIFGGLKLINVPNFIIQKYDVNMSDYVMPLPFANILLRQSYKREKQYQSSIISKKKLNQLILSTLCFQLPESINQPPKMTKKDQQILYQLITSFGLFLNASSSQGNYLFVIENFSKIEEFAEKINIFIGLINPQDQIYTFIVKSIIPLNFMPLISKQSILLKLLQKHTNESFKTHLISQYRKLLTYKAPKGLWIRSIPLMLKQLAALQPKTNIDYIGHIISFAFYWKGVANKMYNTPNFISTLYFDIKNIFNQFDQKLRQLHKGLQKRLQFAESQANQQQRNEINVCLFRVEQLLGPIS